MSLVLRSLLTIVILETVCLAIDKLFHRSARCMRHHGNNLVYIPTQEKVKMDLRNTEIALVGDTSAAAI